MVKLYSSPSSGGRKTDRWSLFKVTTASSTEVPSSAWTENTGLISALIPSEREKAAALPSPVVFNKERGPLKLGPAPLPDGLADEATRLLKEEGDADVLMGDGTTAKQRRLGALSNDPPLVSPELSELPPRPVLFKSIEVKKEVERLRDVRKRIRLEPGPLTASDAELGLDRAALFTRSGALPSVCAYTFHDAGDGYVDPALYVSNMRLILFVGHALRSSRRIPPSWQLGSTRATCAYGV